MNLAARLEGLNKVYGTQVLVTEEIVAGAQPEMVFRLVDRVAVKGKAQAVDVYTLLGRRGEVSPGPVDRRYEEALALYRARRFDEAAAALAEHEGDGPSRILRARCRGYGRVPPPPDWAGVFVATDK